MFRTAKEWLGSPTRRPSSGIAALASENAALHEGLLCPQASWAQTVHSQSVRIFCYPWIPGGFAYGPNVVALGSIDRQGLLDVAFFV